MTTLIRIPKIGIGMTQAVLSEWLMENGSAVDMETLLYSLEMDKSINEIAAPAAGMLKIIGEVGQTYDFGTLIAEIN